MKGEIWFEEQLGDYEKRSYFLLETLYESRSEYQKIEILKLANQGITLVLDDKARVFEVDEFIYHEGITYPALSRHPDAESVLVIGDGDGGIIRELIKHKNLSRIDWVEIDLKVVEICERFLPSFPKHFRQDERVNLIIKDGLDYLIKCYEQYDIIYMSVTAEGNNCYSDAFYKDNVFRLIKRVLKSDGIVTFSLDEFSACLFAKYKEKIQNVKKWFNFVNPFYIGLPSFGSNWGFALGSDVKRDYVEILLNDSLRFYCKDQDNYLFHLPKYLK